MGTTVSVDAPQASGYAGIMNWIKLEDLADPNIFAGRVIRVPTMKCYTGDWYLDAVVDFMVFEAFTICDNAGLGLMVLSGPKAGKLNVIFPESSFSPGTYALSKSWLMENWTKYVYADGAPTQVWIAESDSVDALPDGTLWKIPE
jgi:hypothetical protein